MSPGGSRWPLLLLLITCLMAGPALSQECSAEKVENSIIDINLSLPRGVRGAEPLRVPGAGACVRACCSGHRLAGNLGILLLCCLPGRMILEFGLGEHQVLMFSVFGAEFTLAG